MQFLPHRKDPFVTLLCLSVRSLDLTKMSLRLSVRRKATRGVVWKTLLHLGKDEKILESTIIQRHFSATGETRTIHDRIDCNSKNLIYIIHCLRCNKQYIGETKRRLKDRFNEHRRPVDRPTPSSRPTAVSEHFLSDNHSPNDIELVPLELIH